MSKVHISPSTATLKVAVVDTTFDERRLVFDPGTTNSSDVEVPERYVKALQHPHGGCSQVPFHTISQQVTGDTLSRGIEATQETLHAVQRFDADPNIFVIAAHDATLYDMLEYLPENANDWQEKGWKAQTQWSFLEDLMPALSSSESY
ncbi:hypothetical protein E8E14_002636 [Neopestalotiopsis sp. 37M]|nr:hypothetical protein E8E14_002636 [Neopestalotiopsis sp. 37M]